MQTSKDSLPDEYRKLWMAGKLPTVEQLISAHESVAFHEVAELLLLDQSLRWETVERTVAEQYFVRFPELLEHRESAIDLVFSEFLLMERAGVHPEMEAFIDRFPQFAEALRVQGAFHRAIGMQSPGSDSESPGISPAPLEPVLGPQLSRMPDVPGYRILTELGRGGIGVVYQAIDKRLNRKVALKMLLAGQMASPSVLRRFSVEAEATARLQHPNIVQIHEVGEYEGCPFLALEYINGGTLTDLTRARPQPPREAAALVCVLAGTVQFAHEHGILHRDLKPANVLIQRTEKSGAVHLKIADFGLAKVTAADSDADQSAATMTGDVLGTAVYMSPEQARGDLVNVTAATDVYSLGAILYELLTGRPPFVGTQPVELLGQVIADEPVRPSTLVRRIPRDIQTICLKCLEKNPNRRYESAAALADELNRFLSNQSIVARRTSAVEQGLRWCRRHPVRTILAASLAGMLILGAAIASIYSIKLHHQLALTSAAENMEQSAKVEALDQLWESKLAQADAIRTSNQVGRRFEALRAIDAARELNESINVSPDRFDRMRNATVASLPLLDLRISRRWTDNKYRPGLAVTTDRNLETYAYATDRFLSVHRVNQISEIARISVGGSKFVPLLSDDGSRLAILNDYCRVYRLDKDRASLEFESRNKGVWGFTPDGSRMLGTNNDGILVLVELADGTVVKSFGSISAKDEISISPDAKRAVIYDGGAVRVFDLDTGLVLLELERIRLNGKKHFAWHPDSNLMAVGPVDNARIDLWDVENGVKLDTFDFDTGEVALRFSANGEFLLSYDYWAGIVKVWNTGTGQISLSWIGGPVVAVGVDEAAGFKLMEFLKGGQLSVSEIDHPRTYFTLPINHPPGSKFTTFDLAYSTDGQLLAVVNRGELRIFSTRDFCELDRLVTGYCYIHFEPDGSLLTATEAGLTRWPLSRVAPIGDEEPQGSENQFELGPPDQLSKSMAYSLFEVSVDGNTIAIPARNHLELQTKDHPDWPTTIGPHNDIRRLSISPDGRSVVTGGWEGGKACVWDIPSGKLLHTFDEPNCCTVQFSLDGRWLVTNAEKVQLWNAATWTHVRDLPVSGHSVNGVVTCFSNDSRILAVSDSASRIHLFDPQTGRDVLTLTDPNPHRPSLMEFSPDDNQLAVFSTACDGVVHLWNLPSILDELRARGLDRPLENPLIETTTAGEHSSVNRSPPVETIARLNFVRDQDFIEIEASQLLELLNRAKGEFDLVTARSAIRRLIKLQPQNAHTCNALAWTLATGSEALRDPTNAIVFSRRAVEDKTISLLNRALYMNTLGVALYRAGRIPEATAALEESLAMRPPFNQPFDLFFLAMCSARTGDPKMARDYFDQAIALVRRFESGRSAEWANELELFEQEARVLLIDTNPESKTKPAQSYQ